MSSYDPADDTKAPLFAGRSNIGWIRQSAADRAALSEVHEDPTIDPDVNELHAGTGRTCPMCHRIIAAGQAARLRFDGTYQHDTCQAI